MVRREGMSAMRDGEPAEKENVFLFREMRARDVPACAAIEASAPDGWSVDALREELAQPAARLFVAEVRDLRGNAEEGGASSPADAAGTSAGDGSGGSIAAVAVFQLVCEEVSLCAVTTAPEHRRRGAARALLGYAFARLAQQGARTVFLEVRAQNGPARSLYAALGFETAGVRRAFYTRPPDDAVLMRKSIRAE